VGGMGRVYGVRIELLSCPPIHAEAKGTLSSLARPEPPRPPGGDRAATDDEYMIREPALRAAAANINTKARDRLRMGIVERLVVLETPTNGGEDIAVSCARCPSRRRALCWPRRTPELGVLHNTNPLVEGPKLMLGPVHDKDGPPTPVPGQDSGVDRSISRLAVRLTATDLGMTRRWRCSTSC
jgi:hypothetical protein